jgi:hypothetical protein
MFGEELAHYRDALRLFRMRNLNHYASPILKW